MYTLLSSAGGPKFSTAHTFFCERKARGFADPKQNMIDEKLESPIGIKLPMGDGKIIPPLNIN